MRYLFETGDWIYVKAYGFLYFSESMSKSLCSKCGEKLPDSSIKLAKDTLKFPLMKTIQKRQKQLVI